MTLNKSLPTFLLILCCLLGSTASLAGPEKLVLQCYSVGLQEDRTLGYGINVYQSDKNGQFRLDIAKFE